MSTRSRRFFLNEDREAKRLGNLLRELSLASACEPASVSSEEESAFEELKTFASKP